MSRGHAANPRLGSLRSPQGTPRYAFAAASPRRPGQPLGCNGGPYARRRPWPLGYSGGERAERRGAAGGHAARPGAAHAPPCVPHRNLGRLRRRKAFGSSPRRRRHLPPHPARRSCAGCPGHRAPAGRGRAAEAQAAPPLLLPRPAAGWAPLALSPAPSAGAAHTDARSGKQPSPSPVWGARAGSWWGSPSPPPSRCLAPVVPVDRVRKRWPRAVRCPFWGRRVVGTGTGTSLISSTAFENVPGARSVWPAPAPGVRCCDPGGLLKITLLRTGRNFMCEQPQAGCALERGGEREQLLVRGCSVGIMV